MAQQVILLLWSKTCVHLRIDPEKREQLAEATQAMDRAGEGGEMENDLSADTEFLLYKMNKG